MNTMQKLQLAEMVAEDKDLSLQFSIQYFNHRQNHSILDSIDFALKSNNLSNDFHNYLNEMV